MKVEEKLDRSRVNTRRFATRADHDDTDCFFLCSIQTPSVFKEDIIFQSLHHSGYGPCHPLGQYDSKGPRHRLPLRHRCRQHDTDRVTP